MYEIEQIELIFERVYTCRLNIKTICASVKTGNVISNNSGADKTYFARNNNFYDDDDTYIVKIKYMKNC